MNDYLLTFSGLPNGMKDIKLDVNGVTLNPTHRIPVYLEPDPAFDKLAVGWAENLKKDEKTKRLTATLSLDLTEDPNSPTHKFLKEWADRIRGEVHQSIGFSVATENVEINKDEYRLLPGEMYVVEQNYDFEGSFQPEPRLEVPYKLKWHRHGVSVIGADSHEFQMDILDGPFRSGRKARVWAKHKVKTQDTQIVGKVGMMRGMVMHTGIPKGIAK